MQWMGAKETHDRRKKNALKFANNSNKMRSAVYRMSRLKYGLVWLCSNLATRISCLPAKFNGITSKVWTARGRKEKNAAEHYYRTFGSLANWMCKGKNEQESTAATKIKNGLTKSVYRNFAVDPPSTNVLCWICKTKKLYSNKCDLSWSTEQNGIWLTYAEDVQGFGWLFFSSKKNTHTHTKASTHKYQQALRSSLKSTVRSLFVVGLLLFLLSSNPKS